jgi:hypothetical protein
LLGFVLPKNGVICLKGQPSKVNSQPSKLKGQQSTVKSQPSKVNRQKSTVKGEPSKVNRQRSTAKGQQSKVNRQRSTVNRQPSTRILKKSLHTFGFLCYIYKLNLKGNTIKKRLQLPFLT